MSLSEAMETREIVDRERWDNLWKKSIGGRVYSSRVWLNTVSEIYGLELKLLGVFDGTELVGGVPLFIHRRRVIIPPLMPYNSVILKLPETKYPYKKIHKTHQILFSLIEFFENHKRYSQINFTHTSDIKDIRPFVWKGWRVIPSYTYVLPIDNIEESRSKLSHNIRKNLKKSVRNGIRIEESQEFDIIFNLFKLTFSRRRRWAPIDYTKLRSIFMVLLREGMAKLFVAFTKDGIPVSARVIMFDKDFPIVHDWIAGADPKYFSTGATAYLLWYIIEWLSSQGFELFDLNGANVPSIAEFKRNFGGDLEVHFETHFYQNFFGELEGWLKEKTKMYIKRKFWHELK